MQDDRPEAEAIEEIRAELTEAVRIRMRSDVPLGAFLSGGMDSAAVLALMAKHSSRPVQTFTIGFGDPAYDELDDARSTAAAFGADHHEQIVTPDAVRVADALAVHYDEPFADASAIPSYYVAELARRHVTVCLTGDGGDELFAGYTPYADALARVGGAGRRRAAIGDWRGRAAACRSTRAARDDSARWGWGRSDGSCGGGRCFPTICSRRLPSPISCRRPRCPSTRRWGRFARRPVRCCRGCSGGISATTCPTTSW